MRAESVQGCRVVFFWEYPSEINRKRLVSVLTVFRIDLLRWFASLPAMEAGIPTGVINPLAV